MSDAKARSGPAALSGAGAARADKRPVFVALAAMLAGVLLASTHAIVAVIGLVGFTWGTFFAWLVVLQGLDWAFMVAFWRRRRAFSLGAKNAMILWSVTSVFYWSAAPAYYFFSMSPDPAQLAMAACAYFWEVPGVMGGMFLPICHAMFRPIRNYAQGLAPAPALRLLRRRLLWYPMFVGVTIITISTLGYGIGALQLRFFAFMPPIEQVKNMRLPACWIACSMATSTVSRSMPFSRATASATARISIWVPVMAASMAVSLIGGPAGGARRWRRRARRDGRRRASRAELGTPRRRPRARSRRLRSRPAGPGSAGARLPGCFGQRRQGARPRRVTLKPRCGDAGIQWHWLGCTVAFGGSFMSDAWRPLS